MTDLSSEASASEATAGPGRLLRRAREQAGLSIEDLGAQIKLARGTLDSLERDDFATLSEPVYVRGYYRKLSKVLPVSEAALLSAYESQVAPKAPSPPSKLILAGENDLGGSSRVSARLVTGVLVTGLLIGALAFWGSTRDPNGPAEVVPTLDPATAPEAVPPPSAGLSGAEAAAMAPAEAEATVAPASTENPVISATLTLAPSLSQLPAATSPTPTAAAPAALAPAGLPATGHAEVQLQFNSTSWTRIEDASGKSLLSGVIQAGDRQTLNGEAPFSIFLGNAPGVSIQFNGQPVDMVKYTKGNNTARFTLP
ncbi:MAG: helix-turn-helix domain-containing protein [Stagnimonas sp.]|nr:helix-turn-helix domain-containing protein [Stagnimonas sp.]